MAANPSATFGLTITQAAYGAAFGDAIGVALLNPTLANLQTVISTNAQGEVVIEGDVANDLLTIATGQYVEGIDCDLLPQHQALQGEAGSGPLTLTIGIDTPPQFETDVAGAVFNAPPGGNPPLGTTNTLNTGETLISTVGDAILNFTAVNNFLANPSFAVGVNMTGINEANILNLSDDLAGFAGEITGLTIATIVGGSNPFGDVQLGLTGAGLNTALATLNVDAGQFTPGTPDNGFNGDAGSDENIWIESAAFAGGEVLDINLGGVGTTVDLNVTGGANFYEAVNVSSEATANHLDLDTNATTIATVTVDGDQDLEICGTALNQDTLTEFNSTAATGDVTAFFGGPAGAVTAIGGAGNENFTFLTPDDETGPTTFTADDSVDGGGGDNKLTLQAFEGALLGTGVGPNIVNIQTIVHTSFENDCFDDCNYEGVDDPITVNMANSGSANILELQADYNVNDVSVTNLTNADTVVYSGFDLFDLNLASATPLGDANLTIVEANFGPTDHVIEDVNFVSGGSLNILSIGLADLNQINDFDDVDADVIVTGDVDLTLGTKAAPYDFAGGVVDASAFTGDLTLFIGANSQTVFAGLGNDTIDVVVQTPDAPDLIDLSAGGNDTVVFEDVDTDANNDPVNDTNYTQIDGFVLTGDPANTDTIAIDVEALNQIDLQETDGDDVDAGDAVNIYSLILTVDDLSGQDVNFIKFSDPLSTPGSPCSRRLTST